MNSCNMVLHEYTHSWLLYNDEKTIKSPTFELLLLSQVFALDSKLIHLYIIFLSFFFISKRVCLMGKRDENKTVNPKYCVHYNTFECNCLNMHHYCYTKRAPAAGRHAPGFLKLILCGSLVCVFVCVCVSAPEAINN